MRDRLLGLVLVLAFFGCQSGTVKNTYVTLQDARNDNVFVRGWLPDILPPSAKNIDITKDLDLEMSSGSFGYELADEKKFMERLGGAPTIRIGLQLDQYRPGNNKDLYNRYEYQHGSSSWIFLCLRTGGFCKFEMKYRPVLE